MWHDRKRRRGTMVPHGVEFARPSYRAVLRIEQLRSLLLAALFARLADRMLGLVLVLYALARFHSPLLAGWVGFAALAPGLVVSPLAGALLDRTGPAWGIAADMAGSTASILMLCMLAAAGEDSVASVLCVAGLYSLTNPLSAAGVRTLLPRLVPPAARSQANALDTTIHAGVDVCGPAVAGMLTGLAGAIPALLAVAACYAAACGALLPALRRHPRVPPLWRDGLFADAAAGVAYVVRHPSLRPLALGYAAYNLAWGILLVVVPVLALRFAGSGSRGDLLAGILWAASGVAAAISSLLSGRYAVPSMQRGLMMAGMVATAIAIWPVSARFGLNGLAAGLVLVGAMAGPVDVGVLTLRQHRTDPAWLGRVIAVSMGFNLSGAPIGMALGGALLGWSSQAALVAAAVACVTGALALRWIPQR